MRSLRERVAFFQCDDDANCSTSNVVDPGIQADSCKHPNDKNRIVDISTPSKNDQEALKTSKQTTFLKLDTHQGLHISQNDSRYATKIKHAIICILMPYVPSLFVIKI